LYIVTIVLKYWKRNSNNNNDILHILLCILLLDITVLLTGTPWDLMWNEEALVSQIKYLLVVILKLNGVSEVQYKDVMMIDDGKY